MRPSGETEPKAIARFDRSHLFQRISCDPSFYGTNTDYQRAIGIAERLLNDKSLSQVDKCEVRLALLRIKRVRFAYDTPTLIRKLKDLAEQSSKNSSLRRTHRIVWAEVILFRIGEVLNAKREFDELAKPLKSSEDHFQYWLVANAQAVASVFLGDPANAEAYCHDCLSMFRRVGNKVMYANSLINFAFLKKVAGQYAEAERIYKNALSVFETIKMKTGEVTVLNNIAIIKTKLGDWHAAEHLYRKALAIRKEIDGTGETQRPMSVGKEEINLARLHFLRREFDAAQRLAILLVEHDVRETAKRLKAVAHGLLGGLFIEKGQNDRARRHLEEAESIAQEVVPESDVMTEILSWQAQLHLLEGNDELAKDRLLESVRLCKQIGDKHGLGVALRLLGETHLKLGNRAKAMSAFDRSIRTLRGINECYELMRSCIAYGSCLVRVESEDAGIYLHEARQLCKKLGLDYFMGRIMLMYSKHRFHKNEFSAAMSNLKIADEICAKLHTRDRKEIKRSVNEWQKSLEETILRTCMESAERLRSIGKIYEEARFPIEELKPEIALEVARNVGAENLFLIRKQNAGYRVPLKYNISVIDAKQILTRKGKFNIQNLFEGKKPAIRRLMNGKTLVCVPGQTGSGYVLCTTIGKEKTFTPRDLEFLFASVEAMERVADEYAPNAKIADASDFIDGNDSEVAHPGGSFEKIITCDQELIKIIRLAERASRTTVPVLVEGETGTGKELFARAIHSNSVRKEKQFVAINAGAIPLNLLESQFFGHVRGAFTDAAADRSGLINEAKGGTLFLDEVGEMSEELQVKLLRLLEDGEYRRLGENNVRFADVRIVSATNKDLQERVENRLFREDLYYRLAAVRFKIPSLRERRRDVEFLVRHFLTEGLMDLGVERRRFSVDVKALEAFEFYDWPGNVRELKNEIMRILSLIGDGDHIRFGMLSERIKNAFKFRSEGSILTARVERYERRIILKALEENDWNRSKTAQQIGIPRTTLLFKMKQLNITS